MRHEVKVSDFIAQQIALKKECDRTRAEYHERAASDAAERRSLGTAVRHPEYPTRLRTPTRDPGAGG